ncbi:AraC family transcriptional regulator ligand-binding domain-containing protein [Thalassotalea nanhaiensis]|uniref:AraC family transcriptional regulator ligand-binding domain-containing protein n=1 Tax=Thalassotalea nanhaiensis TaxID=3065648 RepID=A0ABY9TE50_9GAMM|nr:AraC family transcriptional regulator ligand-binding domain-containing protein [Colwelliaceae bacterium SQ345]
MNNDSPSSYYGNISAITQALRANGVDVDSLYEQSGINIADYKDGSKRIPNKLIERFVELAIIETSPTLSFDSVNQLSPASYHALGVGLLYSENLRSFCKRYERYFTLISTMLKIRYVETEHEAKLESVENADICPLVTNFDSDCFVASTLKFLRMTIGPQYFPKKVSLIWTPPVEIQQQYFDLFGPNIEFSADKTEIYFDVNDLDEELFSANIELARESDKTVTNFLEKTATIDIESRVYAKIIEFLPSGDCSRERVAESLKMSPGTLHKKLKAINTSYKELLDTICKELAEQYIGTDGLTIGEAAYLLGVSDCSNFSRSFKRWVGMSPSEYRESKVND